MNEEQREYQEHYSPDGEYIEYLMEHPEINSMNTKEQYGSKLNTPHEIYDSAGFFTNQFNQFTEEARVGYPWTQDGQKMIERITELRSELSDFIRETRVDAVGEVYTFVVNHFTNEQEKFEFFKWWSEKYHPNPINEPLSEFNDL